MKTKPKLKKRILALNIGLLAVMIFSAIHIIGVGQHYSLHPLTLTEFGQETDYSVTVEDESVVRYEGMRFENGAPVCDFSSVGQGETIVHVRENLDGEEWELYPYTLKVGFFGTIFDITEGRLNFSGSTAVINAILVQLLFILVVMIWMFVDYCRMGKFSYPMIACGGLAIYVGILLSYAAYYCFTQPIYSFSYFIMLVTSAGYITLVVLTPPMFILSGLLAVSNIWLMRHEGYRPVNALGIIFAAVWFIGELMSVGMIFIPSFFNFAFFGYFAFPIIYTVGYMECMFLSTALSSFLSTRYKIPFDRDYIIILGCQICRDGSLTPLLRGRVDRAVEFEKAQYEKTSKHAVFVPSGGQGGDEIMSEGEAMEKYLLSIGVPQEQIVREDKSVNTLQNMQLSKRVIDRHSGGAESKTAFSTTNYHVFRGYILAKKSGFEALGLSAKTKPYFYPNAFLREFIGLLVDQKWKHLIFLTLAAAFFTLLSFI